MCLALSLNPVFSLLLPLSPLTLYPSPLFSLPFVYISLSTFYLPVFCLPLSFNHLPSPLYISLPPPPLSVPQLSPALLYDAMHVVVSAVRELNRSQSVGATQLTCQSPKIWEHGTSLMNYLRMVSADNSHACVNTPGLGSIRIEGSQFRR